VVVSYKYNYRGIGDTVQPLTQAPQPTQPRQTLTRKGLQSVTKL